MTTVRMGTRGSRLALVQTREIEALIKKNHPGLNISTEIIHTAGDKELELPFFSIGVKGVFTKEIDEALLSEKIDIATHSLKDLPSTLPKGLMLAAVTKGLDPSDTLISKNGQKLSDLPPGVTVGTSSLRRIALVRKMRPDLMVRELRGNVDTRLRKLDEGQYDAIILAAAGLLRLGLGHRITELLNPLQFIPAIGQGLIGIVCRNKDQEVIELLSKLEDRSSRIAAEAQRIFMALMEGGCKIPLGCYIEERDGRVKLVGFLSTVDGKKFIEETVEGDLKRANELAQSLAEKLLTKGGDEILKSLREETSKPLTPFEKSPLDGKKVVITRSLNQSEEFLSLLRKEGAIGIEIPTLAFSKIQDSSKIDQVIRKLHKYGLLLFTSQNAVRFFCKHLGTKTLPTHLEVAAIGIKTAQVLKEYGVKTNLVPEKNQAAEEMVEFLKDRMELQNKRILFPRAKEGRELLVRQLEKCGAIVDLLVIYETTLAKEGISALRRVMDEMNVDWITFTSGSCVKFFFQFDRPQRILKWIKSCQAKVAVIGRVTAYEAQKQGLRVDVESPKSTLEHMIEAMKEYERKR